MELVTKTEDKDVIEDEQEGEGTGKGGDGSFVGICQRCRIKQLYFMHIAVCAKRRFSHVTHSYTIRHLKG